jgi:hypothetical protein
VSSAYDPLGFVSPVTLQGKIILQELCKLKIGWDDPIPEEILRRWNQWVDSLHQLTKLSVPRCIKPEGFEVLQLCHFSDASLSANSCVAPLKQVSIVRLELTAATVAVRVDRMLRIELQIPIKDSFYWTDSIRNETSRFHTFVANRLQVIHEGSTESQWNHIRSDMNPADIDSRGLTSEKIVNKKYWVSGPSFLWKPESEWPQTQDVSSSLDINDPEVRKSVKANLVIKETNASETLINHFSSWYRLKRAVALFLRVKKMLRRKVEIRKNGLNHDKYKAMVDEFKSPLGMSDMEEAEHAILVFSQRRTFPVDIASFERGSSCVKKSSSLYRLDPVYENIRVGGRLSELTMPEEVKHPIILPYKSHVTDLILKSIHLLVQHSGRNQMLSRLREKYWLIHAPSWIRKLLRKCVACRRHRQSLGQQKMSNLPADRLIPDEPPFTSVGIDYFGPYEVIQKRSHVKRYGVLFTCMTSRAVHIEVAYSLTTDSYINALCRFIARRGQVRRMRSDNGTNFIGAERELRPLMIGICHKLTMPCFNKMVIGSLVRQQDHITVVFGSV